MPQSAKGPERSEPKPLRRRTLQTYTRASALIAFNVHARTYMYAAINIHAWPFICIAHGIAKLPALSVTMRKCRIGTAKFITLLYTSLSYISKKVS